MEFQFFRLLLLLVPLGGAIYLAHLWAFAAPAPGAIALGPIQGEVKHRAAGEEWREASPKTRAHPGDALQSGRASSVVLKLPGEAGTLFLGEQSELVVGPLEETRHSLRLRRGSLKAEIAPDTHRVLRLEVDSTPGEVESVGGRFSLESSGRGDFRLHNLAGEVRLSEAGHSRRLRPGELVVRQPGPRPPGPATFPSTVILKASWLTQTDHPQAARSSQSAASVVGAVVTVHGVYVGQRPDRGPPHRTGPPLGVPRAPSEKSARAHSGKRKAEMRPGPPSSRGPRPSPAPPKARSREPPALKTPTSETPRVFVPSWN
jgi:hypothetical protein